MSVGCSECLYDRGTGHDSRCSQYVQPDTEFLARLAIELREQPQGPVVSLTRVDLKRLLKLATRCAVK